LVENGHSWPSIKKYTLAEIGTFYKTIMLLKRAKKADTLSELWMGNNLQYKDLEKVLSDLGVDKQKEQEPSQAEVKQDWNKLAGALRSL